MSDPKTREEKLEEARKNSRNLFDPEDEKQYNDWLDVQLALIQRGESIDPYHDGSIKILLTYAEEVLCTACLASAKLANRIITQVKVDDFMPSGSSHWREIYRAIVQVFASGNELNIGTLCIAIGQRPHLTEIVVQMRISEYKNSDLKIDNYIRLIRERQKKRRLYDLSIDASEQSKNGKTSKEIAQYIQNKLNEIISTDDMCESSNTAQLIAEHDAFVDRINSGDIEPLCMPYRDMDNVVLYPGNQVVIGAHTSVGKSAFALNIALEYARCGKRVLWISTEMTKIEMIQRAASCVAGIGVGQLRRMNVKLDTHPKMQQYERDIRESGGEFRIFFNAITKEPNILAELNAMGRCDALFIDYIQDLQSVQNYRDDKTRIAYLTSWLRSQAAQREMVLFVLSQLSRPSRENRYTRRKPTEWDLKETGSIENKTEVIILLHRMDTDANAREWQINVDVRKNKSGDKGETQYLFDSRTAQWK